MGFWCMYRVRVGIAIVENKGRKVQKSAHRVPKLVPKSFPLGSYMGHAPRYRPALVRNEATMTTLLLVISLLSSPAHADWCSGIITSSGTCIGSQGNTDPPTIDCDDYGRCWR